VRLED